MTQKKTTKKAVGTKRKTEKKHLGREKSAILLFALGVLLLIMTFVRGANVWSALRSVYFGCFGICTYAVAPLVIAIAVVYATEYRGMNPKTKSLQAALLMLLACGIAYIFSGYTPYGEGFFEKLWDICVLGSQVRGGGFFSVILGWSMEGMFGRTAAAWVIVLLTFVIVCFVFGLTLRQIFAGVSVPAKRIKKEITERAEVFREQRSTAIDIPIDSGAECIDIPLDTPVTTAEEKPKKSKKEKLLEELDREEPEKSEPTIDEIIAKTNGKTGSVETEIVDKSGQAKLYSDEGAGKQYTTPPVEILRAPDKQQGDGGRAEIRDTAERLIATLSSFGIEARLQNICRGPAVTRYEIQLSAGVRINKITNLSDDIALALAATRVRIEAPIPGKSAIGIEIPNKETSAVRIREIIGSDAFTTDKSKLCVALGKDIAGQSIVTDIAKMPHLLIAGATGSGKSVCMNGIIVSLLYKSTPDEVKLLLVDPKIVEFAVYNGIPHLLVPVVTDPRKAAGALSWSVSEMEKRYRLFAENNVRTLESYNELAKNSDELESMPRIVIAIDELADLMMTAPKEVEDAICRLAQKGRAAGLHLVIATQRPSVDVITGLIKANIPSRIALTVSSQVDSRTIIDCSGAEKLLGHGDMLFCPYGSSNMTRIQGCFVSDKEIEDIMNYIKNKEKSDYDADVIKEIDRQAEATPVKGSHAQQDDEGGGFSDDEPLFDDAVEVVIENDKASTSLLQRKLKIGYSRAASIIDRMEECGIVGGYEGSKPRQILISRQQWLEMRQNRD